MNISCGHCKQYHGSIAQVKECSLFAQAAKEFGGSLPEVLAAKAIESRPVAVAVLERPIRPLAPVVPAGHYAIEFEGMLKFFKVSAPKTGRWAGRIFVDVQASDTFYPVKNLARRNEVLSIIAQDPKAAAVRYGRHLGKCAMCHRTLTDEVSIENGIGPECIKKFA